MPRSSFALSRHSQDKKLKVKSPDRRRDGVYAEMRKVIESQTRDLKLLADATKALSSSLEYEDVLRSLARIVVPSLADWCVIDMITEDNSIKRVAVVHPDPKKIRLALTLQEEYPPKTTDSAYDVVRTGKSSFLADISEELIKKSVPDKKLYKILKGMGLRSSIGVPISDRDRIFGTISFVFAESGRHYTSNDLELAEEIGRRAGIAVNNALLYRKLQEADQNKEGFLAILAHELRNPLTPLVHSLEFIKLNGLKNKENQESLDVALRQAHHIVALLKSLLDVTRALHDKIELELETLDAGTIVRNAIETSKPLIEGGRHTLKVSLPREPLKIKVDPLRVEQILVNLLSNAAKYTEPGGRIDMLVTREGAMVAFRVRDTGSGIAPEMLSKIFDLFVQYDQGLSRMKGGLGIGLRLARMLTELHGGTLTVQSKGLGKGSEFTLRLPLRTTRTRSPQRRKK